MAPLFFPFGCQEEALVVGRRRREMPPENVLLLKIMREINWAGGSWQGSGSSDPMFQGCSIFPRVTGDRKMIGWVVCLSIHPTICPTISLSVSMHISPAPSLWSEKKAAIPFRSQE